MRYYYLLILVSLFINCVQKPSEPQFLNDFDCDNPVTHGDPFFLSYNPVEEGVELVWKPLNSFQAKSYYLYRSFIYNEFEFVEIGSISADKPLKYIDSDVEFGLIYWYRIKAIGTNGREIISNFCGAKKVLVSPKLKIETISNFPFTCQNSVQLTIIASGVDSMMFSQYPDFMGSQWEKFKFRVDWDLGINEGEKKVFCKLLYKSKVDTGYCSMQVIFDKTPPELNVDISPEIIHVADLVKFDFTNSVDNYSIPAVYQIKVDWDNDGSFDTEWIESERIQYQFNIPGTQIVTFRAMDRAGNFVDKKIQFSVNQY